VPDGFARCEPLRADPRVSVVIGWDERTVQIDRVANFPEAEARAAESRLLHPLP